MEVQDAEQHSFLPVQHALTTRRFQASHCCRWSSTWNTTTASQHPCAWRKQGHPSITAQHAAGHAVKKGELRCLFAACAACLAYETLAGKSLLRVTFDLEDYNGKLASLHMAPMAGAPVSLRNTLQAMLAQSPSLRPPAISFAAAGYFQVLPPPHQSIWNISAGLLNYLLSHRPDSASFSLLKHMLGLGYVRD